MRGAWATCGLWPESNAATPLPQPRLECTSLGLGWLTCGRGQLLADDGAILGQGRALIVREGQVGQSAVQRPARHIQRRHRLLLSPAGQQQQEERVLRAQQLRVGKASGAVWSVLDAGSEQARSAGRCLAATNHAPAQARAAALSTAAQTSSAPAPACRSQVGGALALRHPPPPRHRRQRRRHRRLRCPPQPEPPGAWCECKGGWVVEPSPDACICRHVASASTHPCSSS